MKTKFLKMTDVANPEWTLGNGGIDFYVPNDIAYLRGEKIVLGDKPDPVVCKSSDGEVVLNAWDGDKIRIPPRGSVLIPLGVCYLTDNPHKHLFVCNKSGKSTKLGLDVGACLCDHSYENVAHAHLFNNYDIPIYIQAIEILDQTEDGIEVLSLEDITYTNFYKDHMKNRGLGGFGSTGDKAAK